MLWFAVKSLRQSIRLGSTATTPLQTPLWLPQGMWVVGFAMFAFVSLILFLRCVARLSQRDYEGVESVMQAQSSEQQELEAAGFGIGAHGEAEK